MSNGGLRFALCARHLVVTALIRPKRSWLLISYYNVRMACSAVFDEREAVPVSIR